MMNRLTLKRWQFVHRWTSLVSTVFLLMLCVTGLPLIFHQEIERSLQPALAAPIASPPSLPQLIDRAVANTPGSVMRQLYFPPDHRLVQVEVGPPGPHTEAGSAHHLYDMQTGDIVPEAKGSAVLDFIRQLHVDMFLALPGALFLGLMGVLMIVAIVSGVVLYGPFTRKLAFGTVREGRRARWLDLHNLLGIVTLAWLTVVGITGSLNTLAEPVAGHWQRTGLAAMAAPYMNGQPPRTLAPVEQAIAAAEAAAPGMWVTGVYYPGSPFATPRHYGVYLRGETPVTARLLKPMLIDAQTNRIDAIGQMPLYVSIILLSQPLHFGDYGGLPLKLLWTVLDVAAIIVLATGLYLYFARGKAGADKPRKAADREVAQAALTPKQQWTTPVVITAACSAGLALALISPPGPGRWISWLLVGLPLVAPAIRRLRRR